MRAVPDRDREISREGPGLTLVSRPRHNDEGQSTGDNAKAGAVILSLPGSGAVTGRAEVADSEKAVNTKTETVSNDTPWPEAESPKHHRAPISVLGLAAAGLWMLAVCLGVGAPLLGLNIDTRLIVGILVASGVVSLVSLPMTAWSPRAASRPRGRRKGDD